MNITVTETIRVNFHGVDSLQVALESYLNSRDTYLMNAFRVELVATLYQEDDE